jgi:RNA polymerase sigma-70 factor (ECF subfamily)
VTVHDDDALARRFEQHRAHLAAVAFRMLGSLAEAEDAVQETWLRLSRSDTTAVTNLRGWLTTVLARVCLDLLRSRKSRREEPLEAQPREPRARGKRIDPETELVLANSVGLALLVVLETLPPPERLAFVLHDLFAVPFDEIAAIVGRTPAAARQLATRARRRIHGAPAATDADLRRQRAVVDAFLAASRGGDLAALVALLDPDVVVRTDRRSGGPAEFRGLADVTARLGKAKGGGARAAQPVLVEGTVGILIAPRGRLLMVLRFTLAGDTIAALDVVAEPERLAELDLRVLD